jgi:AcrR family transcriptional regulator
VPSRLQQERADETRAGLVRAAHDLFTEQGYAGTSTEQLVTRAGVTRGALYHHFEGKKALFEAVFLQLEAGYLAVAAEVVSPDVSAWDNLRAGCRAFLDMCLRRDVQRIVLLDGPSVLGADRWRAIEDEYALAPLVVGLTGAMDEGAVTRRPAVPLARIILAAINEAGLFIAQAPDKQAARREAGEAFDAVLDGLRAPTA